MDVPIAMARLETELALLKTAMQVDMQDYMACDTERARLESIAGRMAEVLKGIIDYEKSIKPAFVSDSFISVQAHKALAEYEEVIGLWACAK